MVRRPTDRPFNTSLTRCSGTWLAQEPDAAEEAKIRRASILLREQRMLSVEFHSNPTNADAFSVLLLRRPEFAMLTLEDWVIEEGITAIGEPPEIIEEGEEAEQAFADYLRALALQIATPKNRRALAAQLRRFLPKFVEAEHWREAVAIDANAFRTSLGNEVSPFLAQITLAGLAAYYETHDEEEPHA